MATNRATIDFDSLSATVQALSPAHPGKSTPPSVFQPAKRDFVVVVSGVAVSVTSLSASSDLLFALEHGKAQARSLSEVPPTVTAMPPFPEPVVELAICAIGTKTASTSFRSPRVTSQVLLVPLHDPSQYPKR
jgi:hypothetical protein